MPLVKIHFVEGRYDEARSPRYSGQPPEDFYQLIFELPTDMGECAANVCFRG